MSFTYKSYVPHGITFGTKHTWRDWRLVPTSRPVFLPPDVKTVEVDIPGSDGILDLTESLTGDVKFNNRAGSIEFQVENRSNWVDVYSEIMGYLHGQRMRAILDDDPDFYYMGRFNVNAWKSEKNHSLITIDYNVEPYKMERFSSLEDWEWDSFNFETGIIREYKEIRVDGSLTFTIAGRRKTVVPAFTVVSDDGSGLQVRFNGTIYDLPDGTSRVLNIVIMSGTNTLYFTGNGTVSIDYRGGRL